MVFPVSLREIARAFLSSGRLTTTVSTPEWVSDTFAYWILNVEKKWLPRFALHSLKKKKTIQTILQPTQIPIFRFH